MAIGAQVPAGPVSATVSPQPCCWSRVSPLLCVVCADIECKLDSASRVCVFILHLRPITNSRAAQSAGITNVRLNPPINGMSKAEASLHPLMYTFSILMCLVLRYVLRLVTSLTSFVQILKTGSPPLLFLFLRLDTGDLVCCQLPFTSSLPATDRSAAT